MVRRPASAAPWLAEYLADRDQLLISRVRMMAGLALPPMVLLTGYMVALDPVSIGLRVWLACGFAAVLFGAFVLGSLPAARRHALPTAIVSVVGLVAVAAAAWHSTPEDLAIAPLNALALILASTLLFPWGAIPQTSICVTVILGYVWAVGDHPVPNQGYAMGLLTTLTPVAGVGAWLIEGWRQGSFRRAWEQEQLVSLARDLAEAPEEDRILERTLAHGGRLLAVESRVAITYEASRASFRIAAEQDDVRRDQSLVGMEFPDSLDSSRYLLDHGVLILPDDIPESPVSRLLADSGCPHALYVTMRHGVEVIGALNFVRHRAEGFSPTDVRLAQAVADQCVHALRNARLVRELRRANQLKSEFVSTMSHELRTPLNVILGFTEMLSAEDFPRGEQLDYLRRMDTAARDLLGLVEDTLEIGRLEADRNVVRREPVDLAAYWRELGAACERLPRRPAVALVWQEAVAPVQVDSDPRKLTVILRNLVGNALKFTERGAVTATLDVEADAIVLRVRDTGIGIRPEDQAVVFEMFRQADGSDARRFGGTGLGLYIVRRFVEQLGGTIGLESAVGEGASFTVRLPATVESLRARAA